jgi:hypothetical protein
LHFAGIGVLGDFSAKSLGPVDNLSLRQGGLGEME